MANFPAKPARIPQRPVAPMRDTDVMREPIEPQNTMPLTPYTNYPIPQKDIDARMQPVMPGTSAYSPGMMNNPGMGMGQPTAPQGMGQAQQTPGMDVTIAVAPGDKKAMYRDLQRRKGKEGKANV